MKKYLFPFIGFIVIICCLIVFFMVKRNVKKAESNLTATVTQEQSQPIITQPMVQIAEEPIADITLQVNQPIQGSVVQKSTLIVSGKTLPRADVFANDREGIADAQGNFSLTVTLDEGENTVSVFATDADGKMAEQEITVTYTPV